MEVVEYQRNQENFKSYSQIMFVLHDRIVVTKEYNRERKAYPFMPDLVGKKGSIFRIQWHSNYSKEKLDGPIYWVRFDEPFKVGDIPIGHGAYDYQPEEFTEQIEFCFTENIKKI